MCEEREQFENVLRNSLKKLYFEMNEYDIIEKECSERAIAFRLGYHIQNEFSESSFFNNDVYKGYIVDAEYNLSMDTPVKEVYKSCNSCKQNCGIVIPEGAKEEWILLTSYFKEHGCYKGRRPYMYPDLIVHKRGRSGPNLAAIEIKCTWNHDPMGRPNDKAKLSYMTCPKSEYKYHMGFFLDLDKNRCTTNLFYPKDGMFFNQVESIILYENNQTASASSIPSPNP